jgi:hypothetical protein
MENLRIIFCLPGTNFSGKFLDCWTNLLIYCIKQKIQFALKRGESSVVNYARTMCLGANVLRGENQLPYNGQIDYTHLMWIDSDMIYTPEDFQKLIDSDKDIVSGLYLMENGQNYAAVKELDENYFLDYGSFHFLQKDEIPLKLFEVAYVGMGFMLVKKGVIESMKYPWFEPLNQRFLNSDIVEFTSEDVAFCMKATDTGHEIWVEPSIKLGHEKKIIIR